MKSKEFLETLKNNKGKNMIMQVEEQIIQKATMTKYNYEIIEDRIYIRNSENLDFAVINLNLIREIQQNKKNTILYIDDKNETKVKISVI